MAEADPRDAAARRIKEDNDKLHDIIFESDDEWLPLPPLEWQEEFEWHIDDSERLTQTLGPEVARAYQTACHEGSRPSYMTRLMLIGHYGAGKSSLKRCLLHKPFLPDYHITNGIDIDPTTCRVDIDKMSNWKHIEGEAREQDSYRAEVLKAVSHLLSEGQEEAKGVQRSESLDTSGVEARTEGRKDKVLHRTAVILPSDELEEQLRQLKLKPPTHHGTPNTPEEEFSVWDFAGQSTFYATHQVFLTHRAIYLVVLNIMQALDSPINTDKLRIKETAKNGISSQPVIDQLDYWLNCVYSHTASHRTDSTPEESIVIVFTHKDQLQQKYPKTASQKIRKYRRSISKHISNKVYCDHVHLETFAIANNVQDDPEIDRLRETIVDLARSQPYWEQEIPLKWISVRDCLREEKKKSVDGVKEGRKGIRSHVMTVNRAWQLCEDLSISSQDELCKILQFYHEIGEFIFFPDNKLRNHIILDPQWLIGAISQVITIPTFHQSSGSPHIAKMWHVLENHGLLTDGILNVAWQEDADEEEEEVKKHLTNLMLKFRLLVPMRVCNMTQVHEKMVELEIEEDDTFLVPCLLPLRKSAVDRVATSAPLPIPTVQVVFKDGFIPVGITSQLISGLVMNEAWLLTGQVFQNHATFLPEGQNTNLSLTIHQQEDRLHLQGHILDAKPTRQNCLRPYLFVLLEQLGFVVRTSCPRATFELAVECRCDHPERSIVMIGATGEGIEGSSSTYCPKHAAKFSTKSYADWFKVESTKKNISTTHDQGNLNDQTLLRVARRLGPEWRGLGYGLVEGHVVEELCTPLQGGPGLYGLRMLLRWYQGLDSPPIYVVKDRLIQVLNNRADLMQNISEHDGPNEQQLFHKLSRGLTKSWREVGAKLGVDAADMDVIETPQMPDYNPGLRMLVTWRNQGGSRKELIRHLKKLKHHAIAQSLELGEI